ncbi:MAG: polysaccharide deacetylase family protein [Firmicutes bacterium]|nr:polysaccharide deacetylase family protein [Bacillota bacterium]
MKKYAVICIFLLILILTSSSIALAEDGEPSLWAIPFIARSAELGLIPDQFYWRFTQPISRAEFCAIAVLACERVIGAEITEYVYFYDSTDLNVCKMAGIGVVQGVEENIFEPDRCISREEAAVLLARLMESLNYPLLNSELSFADSDDIAPWARVEVGQVQAQNIMSGMGEDLFAPKNNFTIEQTIKTMLMVYDLLVISESADATDTSIEEERISVTDLKAAGRQIPILMYHAIADIPTTSLTELFVRPAELENQLKYIIENGYQTITFEDLDNIGAFIKPIMLTFDDGYKDNYTILFPLLKKYNLKATIFIVTETLWSKGRLSCEDIVEMSDSGLVSIQSHTKSHSSLTKLTKEELIEELSSSKEFIEELTGKQVIALCYPVGYTNAAVKAAAAPYYNYAVLNGGGKYTCNENTLAMNRIRVIRGLSIKSFAAMIE